MKQYQIRSILIGCMLLCLTGCTANSEKKRDVLRVGVVLYTQDDPFINALTDCLKEDLAEYESDSLKVIMTVRDGKNDQKIQNEVVKEMLDAGCEILAVDLVDRTEPSNIIKMAKKENTQSCFQRGLISLLILALLDQEDMYGYQIVQEITERSGGAIVTEEGSLYPVLYKLQDQGMLSGEKVLVGKRMTRVYYHLEEPGRRRLQELSREYRAITQGVFQIIQGGQGKNEHS